jgi:phage tail sheath protein FI
LTAGERFALSYAAIYHPWLATARQETLTEDARLEPVAFAPPDGAVGGSLAKRTREWGAWWAPANEVLLGTLAASPPFSQADEESLRARQVNLVRHRPGGWRVMNADTLSVERELQPMNVRRLLILLRRLALREGQAYVFEPNDQDFRDLVRQRFERLLLDMYVRGAFTGRSPQEAYRVVTDDSVNTPQSLDAGRFIVELRVAPSRPLSFLRVRLVQSGPEQFFVQETFR